MINLAELALLGFASYRCTQLVVHDTLLDGIRDRMFDWHARNPASRMRDFVVTLFSCPYCIGAWLSLAVLLTYLLTTGRFGDTPLLVHGIEWFAVAGVQALLNRADDTLAEAAT
ncbi:DUF1360 domain-containing protein [Nonomuraea muscovyensis]|uniref:DUF1360 domain-containing protein n=1 Tax=Nonomuraea muscovyensis TaxID=1124761 RepID=A0A7X0EU37_9ACTN|nr:DUF1360 domain-containing protein [Nonomuraea muscovyensis]MBB6344342.1 hypothetical protein [Nonomuraea muscovyensis]